MHVYFFNPNKGYPAVHASHWVSLPDLSKDYMIIIWYPEPYQLKNKMRVRTSMTRLLNRCQIRPSDDLSSSSLTFRSFSSILTLLTLATFRMMSSASDSLPWLISQRGDSGTILSALRSNEVKDWPVNQISVVWCCGIFCSAIQCSAVQCSFW